MQELISFQDKLLSQLSGWFRYLYINIPKNEKLVGIKGLRGVGKTTLLLQYLKFHWSDINTGLYVTADHPYFYNHSLFEVADEWDKLGGKLLLIDEIHKYDNWSRELKLIYDGFPDMQTIFTSSSALDVYRGESDLSRRLVLLNLAGLSFREYLALNNIYQHKSILLSDLLQHHRDISKDVTGSVKIIPHFRNYLKQGYFPFIKERNDFQAEKIIRIINTVLETDLAYVHNYSTSNIIKIKKILGVIASSAPFEPNISKIAKKLHLGRDTVNQYLYHLAEAYILNITNKSKKGVSQLQKPDKIYLENTSFIYALQPNAEVGTIRETFFLNQLINASHKVNLALKGDFLVDKGITFEIGGKGKGDKQIKNLKNSYIAADNIENGFGNKIPLWLFGFLY